MQLQSPHMQGMIEGGRSKAYSSIVGLPLAFWASRKPQVTSDSIGRTKISSLHAQNLGRRALIGILGNAYERDNAPQGEFVH